MQLQVINIHEDKQQALFNSVDCQQLINIYEEYYPIAGFDLPWVGYFIIRENTIVGSCGFTGKPKNGRVEIAYWTFKEFEGQGVATFACRELISIAKAADPSVIIFAKTAPENNASTKILSRNGFVFSGTVQDHEIGTAWEWTLHHSGHLNK